MANEDLRQIGLVQDSNFTFGATSPGEIPLGWKDMVATWYVTDAANTVASNAAPTEFILAMPEEGFAQYIRQGSADAGMLVRTRFWLYVGDGTGARIVARARFLGASGHLETLDSIDVTIPSGTSSGWVLYEGATIVAPEGTTEVGLQINRINDSVYGTSEAFITSISTEFVTLEQQAVRAWIDGGISPMMFGAVGDGSANDTVPLQAAADYSRARGCPLVFKKAHVYAIDFVDFGDHCDLRGYARLVSRQINIRANYPTQRWVARIGKRGHAETIEFHHSNQGSYLPNEMVEYPEDSGQYIPNTNWRTGIAGQLFIDDYARVGHVELAGVNSSGSNVILCTGHHNSIGFIRSTHYRATPSSPFQERDADHPCCRPITVDGNWSQNGVPNDVDLSDLNKYLGHGNVAEGFKLGGYQLRYYVRAFSLSYLDSFDIGPGTAKGRAFSAAESPGNNGMLIAACRNGRIADCEMSDSGEHAFRLASDNRRGCHNLSFGVLTIKRQSPSAFKINGGGGANVLGAGGGRKTDRFATMSQDISIAGFILEDPFIQCAGEGKASQLLRFSHVDGVYVGFIKIRVSPTYYGQTAIKQFNGEDFPRLPRGAILAMNSIQNAHIGPLIASDNCHQDMQKIVFVASNDIDPYDQLMDCRMIKVRDWNASNNRATASAIVRFKPDTGIETVANPSYGDLEFLDFYFARSGDLARFDGDSAEMTPRGEIWFTGTFKDDAKISITHASNSNDGDVNVDFRSNRRPNVPIRGKSKDVLNGS